jgi:uncharacterized protein
MRLLILFLAWLLLPALIIAQDNNTITIGKTDSVWSATLKESRKYFIYTPPSYNSTSYFPQKYPVIYLLDGDAHFHSVTGLIQHLGTGINNNFHIPEMIVVAIINTNRNRDLTPTPISDFGGGNPGFFTFLKTELIPHIDSAYRTAPYRILVGHSLGGITAINALYETPGTFNAYVAIDPSLWYDNQLLLKKARSYFEKAKLENKFLFVAQANTIQPGDTGRNVHFMSIMQFNRIMQAYNGSGLQYKYKYYDEDDHGSVPLIAAYDALRFIFDGYNINSLNFIQNPSSIKEHFKKFSAKMGVNFKPPERLINRIGHQYIRSNTDLAIEFFQLNIDHYPGSYNAYDSMGEAWMNKGDHKKAIAFYERSLALNPKNEGAKDRLKKAREMAAK